MLLSCASSQPHKRSCSAVGGFNDHVVLRDIMFLSVIMILSPSQSRQISYQKQHHPNNFLDLSLNKLQNKQQGTERGADGPSTLAALQSK